MIEKAPEIEYDNSYFSLLQIFRSHEFIDEILKIENQYLYWDKVKYLKNKNLSGKILWGITKLKRKINSSPIYLAQIVSHYNITNKFIFLS